MGERGRRNHTPDSVLRVEEGFQPLCPHPCPLSNSESATFLLSSGGGAGGGGAEGAWPEGSTCSCSVGLRSIRGRLHGDSGSLCHCPPCPLQGGSCRGGTGWRARCLWPVARATRPWALGVTPCGIMAVPHSCPRSL